MMIFNHLSSSVSDDDGGRIFFLLLRLRTMLICIVLFLWLADQEEINIKSKKEQGTTTARCSSGIIIEQ